ncbi:MAG: GerMN domain-containing protein [Clostridia bacterium]|nr:GerMN domain-containing protein [Clostridia bacterium]
MNRKKILFAFVSVIVILVASFLFVIEEQNPENKSINANLFFFNGTENTIVSESRAINYENEDYLIDAVLSELKKGPKDSKNKPIFNNEVEVLSILKDDRDITVDLSHQFLYDGNSKNLLTTYAIVKSLCQLSDVKSVKVTCRGSEITASDGTAIGFLSDKDIDLVSDEMTKDSKKILLYFADKNLDCLIAENRTVKITDTNPIEQYIVNELIKGTSLTDAKSIISQDTELISAQTTDNVCFVNFKSGFVEKNSGNEKTEKLIIYSIVNSLCELDGVNSVQFLIDGMKIEAFGKQNISNSISADKNICK